MRLAARPRRDLPAAAGVWAQSLASDPAATDVQAIKAIEGRTKHDVKAVEYWIRGELKLRGARAAELEWVRASIPTAA
jgi:adenylosuccinate lyase